jgi:chromatin remodeling complex protein RSC6
MKRIFPFGVVLAMMVVACGSPNTDETEVSTTENGFSRDTLRPVETEGEFSQITAAPGTAIYNTEQQYSQTAAANQGTQTTAGQTSTSGSSSTASNETEEVKKKKMSNTTKGILIGTGAGIITGAAVSKKDRAKGAVIGGIVGAAVGGTTGAVIDKKKRQEDQD